MKKWLLGLLISGLLLLVGGFFALSMWQQRLLSEATAAFEAGQFGKTRLLAGRVQSLTLSANRQHEAQLLHARAFLADDSLDSAQAIQQAYALLDKIPASSPQYPMALVTRAKQLFLVQYKTVAAERALEQALALDPDLREANELLFTIYAATNRPDRADPVFWKVFPQTPPEQQALFFYQWFLSQFTRNAANRMIDERFGVVAVGQAPSDDDIINRFILMKNHEIGEALHYGTMASWWLWKTETQTALEILEVGQQAAKSVADEVYLSSLAQALINRGDFQQAESALQQWPASKRGFHYHRHLGVLQQTAEQFEAAVDSFQRSRRYWPGPIDINVGFRLQQCLRELGRNKEADEVEQQTRVVRLWLEERWPLIRQAIANLQDPESVSLLIEFFQAIGRADAAGYLTEYRHRLKENLPHASPADWPPDSAAAGAAQKVPGPAKTLD